MYTYIYIYLYICIYICICTDVSDLVGVVGLLEEAGGKLVDRVHDLIFHNVSIEWFYKVKSPTKSWTHCLLLVYCTIS